MCPVASGYLECSIQSRTPEVGRAADTEARGSLDVMDAVIEVYKSSVDRTRLRECLKLTPEERLQRLIQLRELARELRRAGRKLRAE